MSSGLEVTVNHTSFITRRMTSTAEGASGWGVFRLGTCLTVVRLSAFDAVEGFPAIGLGVTIILQRVHCIMLLLMCGAPTRIFVL